MPFWSRWDPWDPMDPRDHKFGWWRDEKLIAEEREVH